jgi:hypothetical protein
VEILASQKNQNSTKLDAVYGVPKRNKNALIYLKFPHDNFKKVALSHFSHKSVNAPDPN